MFAGVKTTCKSRRLCKNAFLFRRKAFGFCQRTQIKISADF